MKSLRFKSAIASTAAGLLTTAAGMAALGQDQPNNGRVVQIGRDNAAQTAPTLPAPDESAAATKPAPAADYWIGLTGGPVTPELRAHIDLPENLGLFVREIVPNSPAAQSGLKQYDILLRANDTPLHGMQDLVEVVRTEGQKDGQIALEVLRKGKRQSIHVKPEPRPTEIAQENGNFGQGGMFQFQPNQVPMLGQVPELRRFFEGLNGNANGQMEFRQFGPGMIAGGGGANSVGPAKIPNGVSMSVQKQNDQPARVTVQRGGQTWEAVEGDEESLDNLPADLRPFVEQMLGSTHLNHFQFNPGGMAPQTNMPQANVRENDVRALQQRLDALEQQLRQLMDRQQNEPAQTTTGQAK